jgi:hypothetical protein
MLKADKVGHILAVFTHRIGLEIGVGEASSIHAAESVRSHMRTLLGIRDRSMVYTCSPSEPMLSLAACEVLTHSKDTYVAAVATLAELLTVQNVIIERGKQGEVFVRLLLTIARDQATCWLPGLPQLREYVSNGGLYRVRVITLWEMLEVLLGPPALKAHKDMMAFATKAYVNFTHFVQWESNVSNLSSDFLRKAWERGVAFQGAHSQPVFDHLLVIYCGKLDGPWDLSKLGLFCIQTKHKETAAASDLIKHLVVPLVDGERPKHHFAMLMDLGTTSTFQSNGGHIKIVYEEAQRPSGKMSWAGYDAPFESKRWCIWVRGQSSAQYPVLEPFQPHMQRVLQPGLPSYQNEFQEYMDGYRKELASGMQPTTSNSRPSHTARRPARRHSFGA